MTELSVCFIAIIVTCTMAFAIGSVIINIFDKKGVKEMENNFANEYQKKAHEYGDYPVPRIPDQEEGAIRVDYTYPALGLSEEAGEVAGKFAKAIRDCNGKIDSERKEAIIKELGDVCWFVAELATLLDVNLSDVMQGNLDKLEDRKARGKIHGSGDER